LEWDDRTRSLPGDNDAENISDEGLSEDAVAIQLPAELSADPKDMEKPYFGMGDAARPVNIWHWKSGGTEDPQSVNLLTSKGFGEIEKRDAASVGLAAKGMYENGRWRVVMKRQRMTSDAGSDLQVVAGRFIPIAFAAWDGSNSEAGSKHTMTTWYWLYLKPASGADIYVVPLLVFVFIFGGLLWWARSAAKNQ
jgi:DMSO reductase family type II enzyme heme b subunit